MQSIHVGKFALYIKLVPNSELGVNELKALGDTLTEFLTKFELIIIELTGVKLGVIFDNKEYVVVRVTDG